MARDTVVQPTPYPDVNALLARLLAEVRAVLGAEFVGLYLYGSLSWGDFDPASSDIDFLVVTTGVLPEDRLPALAAMHARIAASGLPWATKLEGSYIPQAALRHYDPAQARHPSIGIDWPFGVYSHGTDWVLQYHILRERGVVVAGPPLTPLIDLVSRAALQEAVREILREFWVAQLSGPDWLRPRDYQAFAILTMCRALYILEVGTFPSKQAAAAWAQTALDPAWAPLIARALAWRHDHQPDDMTDMLAFLRYTLARAGIAV